MSEYAKPPQIRGWSKAGAERLGRRWRPADASTADCYYCGTSGCEECGDPPRLLTTPSSSVVSLDYEYWERGD